MDVDAAGAAGVLKKKTIEVEQKPHLAFCLGLVRAVQERKAVGDLHSGASHAAKQGAHHAVLEMKL